jgi:hypothetical protein
LTNLAIFSGIYCWQGDGTNGRGDCMIAANTINLDELIDDFQVFIDGKVTGQKVVKIS